MPAAPFPSNERQRLRTLVSCSVLDTAPEACFDDLTRLASNATGCPIALVSLLDSTRQWFKSEHGLGTRQTHRDQAFCGYAILNNEPLVIEDATRDDRVSDNPLVTGEPFIRFYTGIPLTAGTDELVGTLCVIDTAPRTIYPDQLATLEALARQTSAQLELRRTLTELAHARETKRQFLANITHELRTPLTAIHGFSRLLSEDESVAQDSAQRSEFLRSIATNSEHLLSVVNDILDLSKLGAERMTIETLPVSPVDVIDGVVEMLAPRTHAEGIEIRTRIEPSAERPVETDPTRLRQILVNLVGNALKFTDEGSVEIRAAVRDGRLSVEVEDTGCGMTEEQQERVGYFDAFVQGDQSTTRTHGGTGIGLHLSNALAKMMGGGLSFVSEAGVGTTFTLEIDAPASDDAEDPTGSAPARPLDRRTVLLVDDSEDSRRLIAFHLERAGAEVLVAADGREGLEIALQHRATVDTVLMDMHMPELDGCAATTELRASGWRGPVLMLTAHDATDARESAERAGCDGFLSKPIEPAMLIEACSSADRTRRAA
ncbi:MAG: ATP-binding protein [Planctomycetota bacterium]